jgi:hypothetical protein
MLKIVLMTILISISFASNSKSTLDILSLTELGITNCKLEFEQPNLQDICYLDRAIKRIHPNAFIALPETEFDKRIDALKKVDFTDKYQFRTEVAKLVADIENPHTRLQHYKSTTFPFKVEQVLSDKVIVSKIAENQNLMYELLKINNLLIDDFINKHIAITPTINGKRDRYTASHYLRQLRYFLDDSEITFTLRELGTNHLFEIPLSQLPIKSGLTPDKRPQAKKALQNISINSKRTIPTITINSFQLPYSTFELELNWELIKIDPSSPYLIIDLRNNVGGLADNAALLEQRIFNSSVNGQSLRLVLFPEHQLDNALQKRLNTLNTEADSEAGDKIEVEKLINNGSRQAKASYFHTKYTRVITKPSSNSMYLLADIRVAFEQTKTPHFHKDPHLFILVNQNTGSASTTFALRASKKHGAQIIGNTINIDTTQGSFGTAMRIKLPNSKINLSLPTSFSSNSNKIHQIERFEDIRWPTKQQLSIELKPIDTISFKQWQTGYDIELEQALAEITE